MSVKELYLENKHRRYNTVKRVKKENIKLEMKPMEKLKDNWIVLLAIVVIIVTFLLMSSDLKISILIVGLLAVFVVLFLWGNKATLICDKTTLNVSQGFQKNKIPYTAIKSVYIAKSAELLFTTYIIVIRYEDMFSFLRELQFSLLCADEKDIKNFIENFEVDTTEVNQRFVKYERRRLFTKICTTILTIGIVIAFFFIFMQ